tara:strand:- start:801 stop:1025 length:225 start_codon:yes stop_codon:yes gene_type:complete
MTYIRYTLTPTKAAASSEKKNTPQPQIPDDFSFNPNLNLGYDVPKLNTDFSKKVFDANPSFPVDFSRTDLPSFL